MEKRFIKSYSKEIKTQYGAMINININLEDLKDLSLDKYWNVSLTLFKRKAPWKFWDTHYLVENNYKKDNEQNNQNIDDSIEEDLPF